MSSTTGSDDEQTLQERVADLERENQELRALLNGQSKKIDRMLTLLVGDRDFAYVDEEMVVNFMDQLENHDERMGDLRDDVSTVQARTRDVRSDGGNQTKKGIAMDTTRNELVLSAVKNYSRKNSDGDGMLVSDIQALAGDKVDLAYQTVKDAWSELEMKWDAIHTGRGADGNRRAKIKREKLTRELLVVVEEDLGRDDLTKELISRKENEGGN